MNEKPDASFEAPAKRCRLKPRAKPSSFGPEIGSLYQEMPKRFRTYISPLLQYASDQHIAASEIDDETIDLYRDQLADWGVQDPQSFISSLIRAWNELRTLQAFNHLQALTPRAGKRETARLLRGQLLPARFWEELDQLFGSPDPNASPAEHNLYNERNRIVRIAETAAKSGHQVGSIADLADYPMLTAAVDNLYPGAARSKARDLALQAIERALQKSGQAAGLIKVVRKVRFRHRPAGIDLPANQVKKVGHFTTQIVASIMDAVVVELERVLANSPDYDALARARACIAVGLAIWNLCPRGTIEQATFSRPNGGGRPHLEGPRNRTLVDLEHGLPEEFGAAIELYHAAITDRLGHAPHAFLDSGRLGPVSGSALSTGVKRFLSAVGHGGLTLQLLRDGANIAAIRENEKIVPWLSDANGFRFASNFRTRFRSLLGRDGTQRIEDSFEAPRSDRGDQP